MNEYDTKLQELLLALANASEKRLEYQQAVSQAREKSEELSTLTKKFIQQPHIQIDDYEIDN